MKCFNVIDGCDGRVLKPGEVGERQKIFSIPQDQPNPLFTYVLNFSDRNVFSKREGFHFVAPRQSIAVVSVCVLESHENGPKKRWAQARISHDLLDRKYAHADDFLPVKKSKSESCGVEIQLDSCHYFIRNRTQKLIKEGGDVLSL